MPDAYDNCKEYKINSKFHYIVIIHTLEQKRVNEMLQKKVSEKPFILGTETFRCKNIV